MREDCFSDLGSGLFAADEWIRFCAEVWDLKPQILVLQKEGKPVPRLECILYRDHRGRIKNPPIHLYLGLRFFTSSTQDPIRLSRQWQDVLARFASFLFRSKGVWLNFPQGASDLRELRWRGFFTRVRYTYRVDLPLNLRSCDPMVRKNIQKAERSGYRCGRLGVEHIPEMTRVFLETEKRQQFSYRTNYSKALAKGLSLIGPEAFRCYGAWSAANELASVRVVLYRTGLVALDWLAGTAASHLSSGVSQFLISSVFSDLTDSGCSEFDFSGANYRSIGLSKMQWGGRLVPFYAFRKRDFSFLLSEINYLFHKRFVDRIRALQKRSRSFDFFRS